MPSGLPLPCSRHRSPSTPRGVGRTARPAAQNPRSSGRMALLVSAVPVHAGGRREGEGGGGQGRGAVRTCLAGDHLVNGLHPGLVAVLIDQERRGSLSRRRSTGEGEGGPTIVLLRQATPGRIVTIILIASAFVGEGTRRLPSKYHIWTERRGNCGERLRERTTVKNDHSPRTLWHLAAYGRRSRPGAARAI